MIPEALARNASAAWGEAGRRWLRELPQRLSAVGAAWDLELGTPYPLSYHWVCRATRTDGTPAVLKLGVPGAEHLGVEAAALRTFAGRGAVRLLEYDAALGALLLERAEPGTPTSALIPHDDEAATAAAIAVMRRLHVAVEAVGLPPASDQAVDFAAHLRRYPGDDPLPREFVVTAVGLLAELTASATQRVALHGDLHHDNVLAAEREPWLVIDPHGLVGDPCYDVGSWLHNPFGETRLLDLVPARLEQLADGLGVPLDRVIGYGFVKAVLSEVWTVEDGGDPDGGPLAVAELLRPRLS